MSAAAPPSVSNLHQFAWIVVNSSGGKDSQTALRATVLEADRQGFDRSRIIVSHQDLGRMEWEGTKELVHLQAACYGLKVLTSKYRTAAGDEIDLLEYARRRGKWPDNKNRWCTSEFKRGAGRRILTQLSKKLPGPILQVFGFRWEESPARAKKKPLAYNDRASSAKRPVWDWHPILELTERQVWDDIHTSTVPYHRAYRLGMRRLSCVFCIFAPTCALMIAGRANPQLLDDYVAVEDEIGHTFKNGMSLRQVRDAIAAGEALDTSEDQGCWNM